MIRSVAGIVLFFAVSGGIGWADLKQVRAETNLEKRSKLALENASTAYKMARAAYDKGDMKAVASAVQELEDSVELAYQSLMSTGKDPRRSPKWFKNAEIATRELVRRLEAFENEMSFDDRPMLQKTKARVQEVHDELLVGLMEGKRK